MHRKASEYLSFRDLIKMSVGDRVGGGGESGEGKSDRRVGGSSAAM